MGNLEQIAFTCSSIFRPKDMEKLKCLLKDVETGSDYKFEIIETRDGYCKFSCVGEIKGMCIDGRCRYSEYAFISQLMELIEPRQGIVIETVRVYARTDLVQLTVSSIDTIVELVSHNTWERYDSRHKALKRLREICADAPSYVEPRFV